MKYIIKKGRHNSFSFPRIHFGINELKFEFKFDKSCLYQIKDSDDYDLNKLSGLSMWLHHTNSIRVGWRPDEIDNTKIQIHTYIYNNKQRTSNYISLIDPDRWYTMNIHLNNSKAIFNLTNEDIDVTTEENYIMPKFTWGYFLDFYIGGNKPARKNTICWVYRL